MRPKTIGSGIFNTNRSSAVSVSRFTRMLVPNPKNAFQSPGTQSFGLNVENGGRSSSATGAAVMSGLRRNGGGGGGELATRSTGVPPARLSDSRHERDARATGLTASRQASASRMLFELDTHPKMPPWALIILR